MRNEIYKFIKDSEYYCCHVTVPELLEKKLEKHNNKNADFISQYINLAELTALSPDDYGDSKKVTRNNLAAKKMRAIATLIQNDYPEKKNEFMQLLNNSSSRINVWVAHHMLEVMDYDTDSQRMALDIIELEANGQGTMALGNRVWLNDWYSKNPHTKRT